MNVEELKNAKMEMESAIYRACLDFETGTGLTISDISLVRKTGFRVVGNHDSSVAWVNTRVELGSRE